MLFLERIGTRENPLLEVVAIAILTVLNIMLSGKHSAVSRCHMICCTPPIQLNLQVVQHVLCSHDFPSIIESNKNKVFLFSCPSFFSFTRFCSASKPFLSFPLSRVPNPHKSQAAHSRQVKLLECYLLTSGAD
jgi:hypothetical protein